MDMNQFLEVYMEEADEQIQIMEEKMLLLEQGSCDAETIQSLFRAAHTLKGSSAAMGFDLIKNVTHEMESLLDLIRNNQLDVTLELVELLIDQVGIKQAGRMLNLRYRGDEECSKLAGQTDHLGRVIHELQEQVMKIRMLSAEQLFSRMPRIVRDLSKPDLFLKKINLLIQALRRSYPLRYKQPESPNARSRLKRG